MSSGVSFTPQARLEAIDAYDWYENRAPGLGDAFIAEVDRQVLRILARPLQFPVVLADVRRVRLRRFPYALFFRLTDDGATIVACFHGSRDPRIWKDRL